jgi:hypothetical protein
MTKVDHLVQKIRTGSRVRVQQDFYGREYILVRRWWLPLTHKRVHLSFDEKQALRAALAERTGPMERRAS